MAWPSKRRPYLRCNLESSKCVRRYLLCCCFFASKYVILHQRHLSCCSLSFKHIRQGLPVSLELPTRWLMPFVLPFSLEKVKANFCSCLKTCECMSQTLLYAFWAPELSGLHCLLGFNLQKDQTLFDSLFWTSQYPLRGWFWYLKALNTCAVRFVLLYSVSKGLSYPSSSSLTSKNNSYTLFDSCLIVDRQKRSTLRSLLFSCF